MIIFYIIIFIFLYALIGLLITLISEAVYEYNPNFFGKVFDELDETNRVILELTFWPFFLLYVIGWSIIWYITHLIIAIKSLFKSINIKNEKDNCTN